MEKVFEIYIRTTPERLWEAITDPEIRSKYNFGAAVDSDGRRFADRDGRPNAGGLLGEGEVLEVDPRGAWCTPWWPCGATTCRARARRG